MLLEAIIFRPCSVRPRIVVFLQTRSAVFLDVLIVLRLRLRCCLYAASFSLGKLHDRLVFTKITDLLCRREVEPKVLLFSFSSSDHLTPVFPQSHIGLPSEIKDGIII